MASVRYYVSQKGERWNVQYDGKDYAFGSQSVAVLAAVKAATSAFSFGHEAEVLLKGDDGKWRTEWPSA
ncbi:DUF2188 domain-containing protein [Mesorhizobium sp. B2-5-9]|uniref:DUF2188 domain-containing protein n=1 Tax=Mesorhizobium sp. B2-5-9 TaxID=2589921 RepID=UPI00112A34E7|nr:DUF2188 domain-containing protein [Mesorhizobium sp. B2-5-9]TPK16676.1 DUF2188 domain-containing protein [Mesorhizobium sp. B2-5-9]